MYIYIYIYIYVRMYSSGAGWLARLARLASLAGPTGCPAA